MFGGLNPATAVYGVKWGGGPHYLLLYIKNTFELKIQITKSWFVEQKLMLSSSFGCD
jgi:hypothetical protein